MFYATRLALSAACISLIASTSAYDATARTNVALYFGQGSTNEANLGLAHYCDNNDVDIIPLAFLNAYLAQGDGYGGTNFANSCWADVFSGPGYNNVVDHSKDQLHSACHPIIEGIGPCQAKGKKILLSLGGAIGPYRLNSDKEATDLADFLWGAFGPKDNAATWPRPFDNNGVSQEVDGFDLDIEQIQPGEQNYYITFVNQLRSHFPTGPGAKQYLITGAPQCISPDANMGEIITGAQFDILFVQYYNTDECSGRNWVTANPHYGSSQVEGPSTFKDRFQELETNLANGASKDAKLYFGLPGSTAGVPGHEGDYLDPETEIAPFVQAHFCDPRFGGVMIWEAGYAEGNVVGGKTFQKRVKEVLMCDTMPSCGTSSTSSFVTSTTISSTSASTTLSATSSTTASTTSSTTSEPSSTTSSSTSSSTSSTSSSTTSSTTASTSSSDIPSTTSSASTTSSETSSTTPTDGTTTSSTSLSSTPKVCSTSPSASSSSSTSITTSSSSSTTFDTSSTTSTPKVCSTSPSASSSSSTSTTTSSSSSTTFDTSSTTSTPKVCSTSPSASSSSSASTTSSSSSTTFITSSTTSSSTLPSITDVLPTQSSTSTSQSYTSFGNSTTSSSPGPPTTSSTTAAATSISVEGVSVSTTSTSVLVFPIVTSTTAAATSISVDGVSVSATSNSVSVSPIITPTPSATVITTTTTTVYTITSCPPTVLNCPLGKATTETIVITTTFCPASASSTPVVVTPSPIQYTTSYVYTTTVYTVTACPPTVTNCPARGSLTTETRLLYTTVCPVGANTTPGAPAATAPGAQLAVSNPGSASVTNVAGNAIPQGSSTFRLVVQTMSVVPVPTTASGIRTTVAATAVAVIPVSSGSAVTSSRPSSYPVPPNGTPFTGGADTTASLGFGGILAVVLCMVAWMLL